MREPILGERRFVVHCQRERFDVYIGRPSKWGNPFHIKPGFSRTDVIRLYRAWLEHNRPDLIDAAKIELRGKILGCYCAPLPCHGDVLAELANADE